MRKCRYCKNPFEEKDNRQIYCKPSCRVRFSQKKYKRPTRVRTTLKQQQFAEALMVQDGKSEKQKYVDVYGESKNAAFLANVAKNSRGVQSLLHDSKTLVETTLINTVKDWGDHDKPRQREIAQNAAMYIHDKVEGKATVRVEQRSEIVNFNINLRGDDDE